MTPDYTRRSLLGAAGGAGLAAVVAACGGEDSSSSRSATSPTATAESTATTTATATPDATSSAAALLDEATSCSVAPETTEGPYYFDAGRVRSDIREDREGVALRLALRVQRGEECAPVKDAIVSIWHCDAVGAYSGFESQPDEIFLRGEQVTNADGVAEFLTVYPGWYPGRAVHAHLKVILDNQAAVTTQLFFAEDFTDEVFSVEPYRSRGERDTRIDGGDGVYSQADAEGTPLLLTLRRDGDEVLGAGNIVIARGPTMSHDHELDPAHVERPTEFRGRLRRREALGVLGVGLAGLYGVRAPLTFGSEAAAAACLLQREVTEGPYYLDLDLVRRNIKGGKRGTPLTLRFQVVDATTCKAISNAAVEIWHCDALGVYSGVAGNSGTFLRGLQNTDSGGRVRFESIVPGWYRGRTPHIHMKVFVGGDEVHTGQVFFRSAVLRPVYRQGVYASRGQADTSNGSDNIYGEAGSRALLAMKRKGASVSSGYTGSLVIGVNPS